MTETREVLVRTTSTGIVHRALVFTMPGRKDQTMIVCGSKQAVQRITDATAEAVTCKRCNGGAS